MKTPLGNLEIQNVIDFLLIRKTGSSSSYYHDWIDASAQKNEAKILSNQLEEKDAHVDLTKFLSRFSGQRRQSNHDNYCWTTQFVWSTKDQLHFGSQDRPTVFSSPVKKLEN